MANPCLRRKEKSTLSRKTKFAVRSVRFRKPYECLEHYLKDYEAVVRTGFWKCRVRDHGETTWHPGIDDWWIELEMRLAHLPSFMQRVGHPVILDLELPEIRELTKPGNRRTLNRWEIWTGPSRPAYKLTIYDDYRE
jgi:hypothetical protein